MTDPRYAEMLAGLIAIDTTSRRSNLPLLDHVEAYLGGIDCRFRRIGGQEVGTLEKKADGIDDMHHIQTSAAASGTPLALA